MARSCMLLQLKEQDGAVIDSHTAPSNTAARRIAAVDPLHDLLHEAVRSLRCCTSTADRIEAAMELSRFLLSRSSSPSSSRAHLAAAAAIPALVSMLHSASSSPHRLQLQAKGAALHALLNLAMGNDRNKVSIIKAGAIAPLAELLRSRNANLRELAAATIAALSASDANKAAIGASSSSMIPLLVRMISDPSCTRSVKGKADAVVALYNLSTLQENRVSIIAAGAATPLARLLKQCKKSSKLAEKAMGLLEFFMESEEGRCSLLQEEGGLLAVVEVLEEGSALGREHAVGSLLAMCQTDRLKYRDLILKEGAIPSLLELSVQGTYQARQKAQELLRLLRDPPPSEKPSTIPSAMLESIVSDIASHVDTTGAARKMLTEIVQLYAFEMEPGASKHLQSRALVHASAAK